MAMLPMNQRILCALESSDSESMTIKSISKRAEASHGDHRTLCNEVQRMTQANVLIAVGSNRYAIAERGSRVLEGRVVSVSEKYGFIRCDQFAKDVFVAGKWMLAALPGDRVVLCLNPQVEDSRASNEGTVLRIVEAAEYSFSGKFIRFPNECFVVPENGVKMQFRVAAGESQGIPDGNRVAARIARRGLMYEDHRAEILKNAGPAGDVRACCTALVYAAGAKPQFRNKAVNIAAQLYHAGVKEKHMVGRADLRDVPIFSIDGARSKDLDDAVSLRQAGDGWELGVHIADVSHYVTPGILDAEAFERGTSIYYGDQVAPMLPEQISNGICSLNAGKDRLALSVFITLDSDGEIRDYQFEKTVICSCVRGVYGEVNALLSGEADEAVLEKYARVAETLREMQSLAALLKSRRRARGAVDLVSVESEFLFDSDGMVSDVIPHASGVSEGIIEEFMLVANQAAARFGTERELPFIYRIHEPPSEEKADILYEMLARIGVKADRPKGGLKPGALRKIIDLVRGSELQAVVNTLVLRTMAKARYSEENVGHFGLTLPLYTHFTSPIRRYSDLAVHRIISAALEGVPAEEMQERYKVFVHEAALRSSAREVRAMTLERQCSSLFMAQFMERHIGECFSGTISGVAQHGFYVLLPSTVEGLVHVKTLENDKYVFDGAITLIGMQKKRSFRVGDAVRVRVLNADAMSGYIDFELMD